MTIWKGHSRPILASQSAARQGLLLNAGFAFDVVPAGIDERALQRQSGSTDPSEIARCLANAKAVDVSARHPDRYVIGADQTLSLGDRLFNKPDGRDAAKSQLTVLAGKSHKLHSAVVVARGGKTAFSDVATASLTMRALDEPAINAYLDLAGDAVTASVGAYQLESLGIHLFERIEGDHFTILGLPLMALLNFFRRENLLVF